MEIKITTNQILAVLQILSWIIFVGLCVEAGAIIVNTVITLFINPAGVENYWKGSDYLSSLHKFNQSHFIVISSLMIIVSVLKAIMFYLIVKLFVKKQLNISQPFSRELRSFIILIAYLALGIGLFSYYGLNFSNWLSTQGFAKAHLESLSMAGADVWLFMVVILFVITQVIKKGIEIQNENALTI